MDIDAHIDKEKITYEIKQAIQKWMALQYPDFGENFSGTLKEVKHQVGLNRKTAEDLIKYFEGEKNNHISCIKKEINEFLSEEHPGIFSKLKTLQLNLESLMKKFLEKEKVINEKFKKIVESSSLCEDVYRMRDELKETKKSVDVLAYKLKNVFK